MSANPKLFALVTLGARGHCESNIRDCSQTNSDIRLLCEFSMPRVCRKGLGWDPLCILISPRSLALFISPSSLSPLLLSLALSLSLSTSLVHFSPLYLFSFLSLSLSLSPSCSFEFCLEETTSSGSVWPFAVRVSRRAFVSQTDRQLGPRPPTSSGLMNIRGVGDEMDTLSLAHSIASSLSLFFFFSPERKEECNHIGQMENHNCYSCWEPVLTTDKGLGMSTCALGTCRTTDNKHQLRIHSVVCKQSIY